MLLKAVSRFRHRFLKVLRQSGRLTAWNTLKNQSTGAEASEELIGSIGYNPFIGSCQCHCEED